MKQYLISLVDSDHVNFKLVDSNVWNWIMSGSGDENVPNFISDHPNMELDNEEFENMHFGTINDRANGAPGKFFEEQKDLQEYVEVNKIEIAQGLQANLE